ncbi:MAG: tetratricopeptide repeat protein [Acetobacteraceae bacterium]|nr:tetratricopeptide repeat protein [Acetobacteraceae bacterium]
MPPRLESPNDTTAAAALVAEAARAHAAGRNDEAAGLLEQARPGAARLPAFWELDAALALATGAPDRAVAALERCAELARSRMARPDARLPMNLALARVAAGRLDEALAAREEAAEALAAQRALGEAARPADHAQLREVDERLAQLLWERDRPEAAISARIRAIAGRGPHPARVRIAAMLAGRDRLAETLLALLTRALLAPDSAVAARDIGRLLAAVGGHEAARAWFRRTVVLAPQDAETAAALGEPDRADDPAARDAVVGRLHRPLQGLASAPQDAVWPMALARALLAARTAPPPGAVAEDWDRLSRDAAVAALRRSLALQPGQKDAAAELARLLLDEADPAEGVAMLRAALKLAPEDAALHLRLGEALRQVGEPAAAMRSFRTALGLQPDLPGALLGLADALLTQGPDATAIDLVDRALALDPAQPIAPARAIRALALAGLQQHDAALAEWDRVLALRPDDADAHFGRAMALLVTGRYDEGWAEYAWRWRRRDNADANRMPAEPLSRPDPAQWPGRTVLLYSEQAQGDSIQFLRYARLVAARGARVVLEVHRGLKTLAAGIPDLAGVFARGDELPPHDIAVPLLHLPWAFGTTLETIPATVPYLRPELTRAAAFRRRMQGLPGLKVGLVWSGEPRPHSPSQSAMDRRRSVTLAALAPLARVPGVVWVSLQKGAPAAQAAEPPAGMVLHDWTDELEDFAATAALMTALDLVISVDTAPAHLAGALGRPVWLLNRFDTDFRWLSGRDDSPWYPTMRQFRQARPGDWDEVIARLALALRERAG